MIGLFGQWLDFFYVHPAISANIWLFKKIIQDQFQE